MGLGSPPPPPPPPLPEFGELFFPMRVKILCEYELGEGKVLSVKQFSKTRSTAKSHPTPPIFSLLHPGSPGDSITPWVSWFRFSGTLPAAVIGVRTVVTVPTPEHTIKGVSTRRRRGEGMQLPYSQYRGRNAGGY